MLSLLWILWSGLIFVIMDMSGSGLIFVLVNINPWILTEYIVKYIMGQAFLATSLFDYSMSALPTPILYKGQTVRLFTY